MSHPWSGSVVYQVYPRSFADSDGDGVGDLRGVSEHLDHIAGLGVDVVWLSPVYRSPMADFGYDIADYTDVDPLFGTLADLDALIAGAHARGMKLVMDLVVNHTSDEHPWFVDARRPGSAKRDWYVWRPAREGHVPGAPGAEPTNWGSFFSGPAWTYDEASGEYYLHLFDRRQPDLNWENPEVRQAVYAMMRGWVARGVDGFRMDVFNLVSKTYPLADGPVNTVEGLSHAGALVADGPRVAEFIEEMSAAVGLAERGLFTVGEMPGCSVEDAAAYTALDRPRLGMVFQFEHMGLDAQGDKYDLKPLHLPELKQNLARWQEGLQGRGWNSLYWNNHDQPRIVSRWGDDSPAFRAASAKTLATVLHLHQGTPFVYQGEELGMTNGVFASIDDHRDVEALNHHREALAAGRDEATVLRALQAKGRDNARTPMCWSDAPHAGFTTGTPWLRVNGNFETINAAAQVDDPASVYHHYRRLIALRHELAVVRDGGFELLLPDDERLWTFTRTLDAERLLVLANLTSEPVDVPAAGLPSMTGAEVLLATHPGSGETGTLGPWESVVLRLAG